MFARFFSNLVIFERFAFVLGKKCKFLQFGKLISPIIRFLLNLFKPWNTLKGAHCADYWEEIMTNSLNRRNFLRGSAVVGASTLAAPAMAESVKITAGDASVAVGFANWGSDITDISNIQGAYTISDVAGLAVTASGDYNMDTENTVVGASASGLDLGVASLGGTVTYDVDAEKFAFEGVTKAMGLTAYINGDQDDTLQNIGGEYVYGIGGAELSAGANYNVDTEDFTPTVGVSFSF